MQECSIPDCSRKRLAKGLCQLHYTRQRALDPAIREACNARQRQWQASTKGQRTTRRHRLTPERRFQSYLSRAKDKGYGLEITLETFIQLTARPCHYCGGFARGRSWSGLDRVDPACGYVESNVVPCCEFCNKMKLDRSLGEFIAHLKQILAHWSG
jgi:hypothetical protein